MWDRIMNLDVSNYLIITQIQFKSSGKVGSTQTETFKTLTVIHAGSSKTINLEHQVIVCSCVQRNLNIWFQLLT